MNQKKYWLRGGIIIGLIGVALGILSFIFSDPSFNSLEKFITILNIPTIVVSLIILIPLGISQLCFAAADYTCPPSPNPIIEFGANLMIGFIVYFIIGMTLGSLYGKIKNRNK